MVCNFANHNLYAIESKLVMHKYNTNTTKSYNIFFTVYTSFLLLFSFASPSHCGTIKHRTVLHIFSIFTDSIKPFFIFFDKYRLYVFTFNIIITSYVINTHDLGKL